MVPSRPFSRLRQAVPSKLGSPRVYCTKLAAEAPAFSAVRNCSTLPGVKAVVVPLGASVNSLRADQPDAVWKASILVEARHAGVKVKPLP